MDLQTKRRRWKLNRKRSQNTWQRGVSCDQAEKWAFSTLGLHDKRLTRRGHVKRDKHACSSILISRGFTYVYTPTTKYTHQFYMTPSIDWHNISHILRQYTTCLNLLPIDFDYFQSQNSDRAQNINSVTLHGQFKGISTYKTISTLTKKRGIKH